VYLKMWKGIKNAVVRHFENFSDDQRKQLEHISCTNRASLASQCKLRSCPSQEKLLNSEVATSWQVREAITKI